MGGLIDDLLTLLQENQVDHTSFFRQLGTAARGDATPVRSLFINLAALDAWMERFNALPRVERDRILDGDD